MTSINRLIRSDRFAALAPELDDQLPEHDTHTYREQRRTVEPHRLGLLAQIVGVAEPVTGSLVLLAVLAKHELNEFCGLV